MSGSYLQRLFDRAAATPPVLAAPGGPSRSPVAMADQRLNEPGFADMFSFSPPPLDEGFESEAAPLVEAPSRPSRAAPPPSAAPVAPVAAAAPDAGPPSAESASDRPPGVAVPPFVAPPPFTPV
ncbi:MAG: hypothetical protein ACXWU1_09395, partial [Allosphingosinicella sp.]